jgi:hypothetical protein
VREGPRMFSCPRCMVWQDEITDQHLLLIIKSDLTTQNVLLYSFPCQCTWSVILYIYINYNF